MAAEPRANDQQVAPAPEPAATDFVLRPAGTTHRRNLAGQVERVFVFQLVSTADGATLVDILPDGRQVPVTVESMPIKLGSPIARPVTVQ